MPHPHDDPRSDAWPPRDCDAVGPPDRQPRRRYEQGLADRTRAAPPDRRPGPEHDPGRHPEPAAERAPHPAEPDPSHPHGRVGRDRDGAAPRSADAARASEAPQSGVEVEPPDFDDETQERIYSYVARHAGASADAVRDALGLGVEAFTYHLEALRQQGYVEERADGLYLTRTVASTERAPGTPTVVVRPARQSDLAGLVAVMREVTDERTHVVAESVAEQVAYEETVRQHTNATTRTFFVATVDDHEPGEQAADAEEPPESDGPQDGIVGWAHLTMPEVGKLSHTAELTVGVLDAYRRLGVGTALLERALDRAAADGRHRVHQSLPATNRAAISFLDAHGWRVEAVRENHYRIDGSFVDEVMMAIEL